MRGGSDKFFQHYKTRRSRSYFIRYDGQEYDMKAIARVARGLVLGQQAVRAPLGLSAAVRRRLEGDDFGFEIVHHEKTFDRESAEGRCYWTKQKRTLNAIRALRAKR